MIGKSETDIIRLDKVHRPVQSPKHIEVAAERGYVRFRCIACPHGNNIWSGCRQLFGDFKTKGTECPAMLAEQNTVTIDVRY